MIGQLKSIGKSVIDYLGEAKHRRFVAVIVAMAATHFAGQAFDAASVANVLEILVGGIGGAWSSTGFLTKN